MDIGLLSTTFKLLKYRMFLSISNGLRRIGQGYQKINILYRATQGKFYPLASGKHIFLIYGLHQQAGCEKDSSEKAGGEDVQE
jgi:hypothetical protein